MTKREAQRVARHIARLQGIQITGTRVYPVRGGASYEIDCVDTGSGAPFIVRSMDDLANRMAAGLRPWK